MRGAAAEAPYRPGTEQLDRNDALDVICLHCCCCTLYPPTLPPMPTPHLPTKSHTGTSVRMKAVPSSAHTNASCLPSSPAALSSYHQFSAVQHEANADIVHSASLHCTYAENQHPLPFTPLPPRHHRHPDLLPPGRVAHTADGALGPQVWWATHHTQVHGAVRGAGSTVRRWVAGWLLHG